MSRRKTLARPASSDRCRQRPNGNNTTMTHPAGGSITNQNRRSQRPVAKATAEEVGRQGRRKRNHNEATMYPDREVRVHVTMAYEMEFPRSIPLVFGA